MWHYNKSANYYSSAINKIILLVYGTFVLWLVGSVFSWLIWQSWKFPSWWLWFLCVTIVEDVIWKNIDTYTGNWTWRQALCKLKSIANPFPTHSMYMHVIYKSSCPVLFTYPCTFPDSYFSEVRAVKKTASKWIGGALSKGNGKATILCVSFVYANCVSQTRVAYLYCINFYRTIRYNA